MWKKTTPTLGIFPRPTHVMDEQKETLRNKLSFLYVRVGQWQLGLDTGVPDF